jgi:hypothetical protein
MNSANPPANLPNEDQNVQAPKDGPQSLPQEELLSSPDQGLTDPDEHMKRIQREGEINKVTPQPENNIGIDTTGVGSPTAQAVNQGQSLPQSAIPVDNKFDGKTEQFYDPNAAEVAKQRKEIANAGGQKTEG